MVFLDLRPCYRPQVLAHPGRITRDAVNGSTGSTEMLLTAMLLLVVSFSDTRLAQSQVRPKLLVHKFRNLMSSSNHSKRNVMFLIILVPKVSKSIQKSSCWLQKSSILDSWLNPKKPPALKAPEWKAPCAQWAASPGSDSRIPSDRKTHRSWLEKNM